MTFASCCIPTNAKKEERTRLLVKSIRISAIQAGVDVQIILCGDVHNFKDLDTQCVLVECSDLASDGFLAKMRNLAAEQATADNIIFVDDDFLFPLHWFERFKEYDSASDWRVLTTRVLLPSGGRFWDRALFEPHQMVDYDHDPFDPKLYITGGFWILKKDFFAVCKWNSELQINATQHGHTYNEDIEMSIRAHSYGVPLSIDPLNYVWHWDEKYIQSENVVIINDNHTVLAEGFKRDLGMIRDAKGI